MVILIKVNIKMVKHMAKEYILGLMEKSMMVNGLMELRKVMVFGRVLMEILILANGRTARPMVMEYINGRMVIDMKANGNNVLDTEMELTFFIMVMYIKDNISMENLMG